MAAAVKTQELKKAIKNILKDADLDSLSAKKVRRKLEESFGIDLTERRKCLLVPQGRRVLYRFETSYRKKEIDALTMKMITEGVESDDEPTDKTKSKDNGRVVQNGSEKKDSEGEDEKEESGNDSDSSFDEPDPVPVIKKRKIQKPAPKSKKPTSGSAASDDDEEVNDEELAKQLQQEEDMNLRTRRRPQKKAHATRKPREKKERKGTSMYSKPCQLSPELAAVVGQDQGSRHEIVKRMWEVMRERNLQDPKNKQFMICDPELQKIFGRKRVRMFGMMKWLAKHIRSVDDLVE